MIALAHYAFLSAVVLAALSILSAALMVWRWWAEESYAREADQRREPERARMDAAMEDTPVFDALCFERWEAEL